MKSFFVSYVGADHAWAEWIAWELEAAGYSVSIQAWDSRPGNNFVAWMDQAVRDAERVLVVLSPAYERAASFTVPEWSAALGRDPTGELGILLLVRVADFIPGGLFRTRGWIDLAGKDRRAAAAALSAGIRQERLKPPQPPAFPGELPAEPTFPGSRELVGRVWNVPLERNPAFTGRQGLLSKLHGALSKSRDRPVRVALAGMGGVGKTALVVEHIHQHRDAYQVVWWVRAEQPETLVADLAALASGLGLSEASAAEQELALAAVNRWLATYRGWLLVFDNAEPTEAVTRLFPGGDGRLLVTSRDPAWRRHMTRLLSVEVLDRSESVRLLQRRTGDRDPASADQLADALGDLPLALEQAGAYCEAEQLPLAAYLERLRTDAAVLFAEGQPVDYTHTIATTWTFCVEKAAERSAHAPDLLRLLAFLGPDDIPWDLLAPKLVEQAQQLGALGGLRMNELDHALGALARYSLITRTSADVTVHRLVQQVVRDGLDPHQQPAWAVTAVGLLLAVFPDNSHWQEAWPVCQRLLPHALVAAQRVEQLGGDPAATAALLQSAALYLYGRAEFSQSRLLLERALVLQENSIGPEHLDVAVTLTNLGRPLRGLGEYTQARDAQERALAIRISHLHPDDPAVAESLNEVGVTLRDLGEFDQARSHLEQALTIRRARLGPDHLDVAWSLNNLGNTLRDLGDLNAAKSAHEQALAIRKAQLGPDHTEVARSLTNLGNVLRDLGDLVRARSVLERSLAIREAKLGPDHPVTSRSLNALGNVLFELGDLAQARSHLEQALAIRQARLGPNHPDVAWSLNNLGNLLCELGDLDQARSYFERALAIRQARLGPDHPDTLQVQEDLTHLPLKRGRSK